jgi:hypothetical protein
MTEPQRFAPIPCGLPDPRPPVDLLPMHMATSMTPRRNLCAEFSQMPVSRLLEEAEEALVRLDRAGRPTDYAVMAALVRRVKNKPVQLEGALWLSELLA